MKKTSIVLAALLAVTLSLTSCATLQQDVYTYTEENSQIFSSIEIYEERFIKIDAKAQLERTAPLGEISGLLADIEGYKNSVNVTEPYLNARLKASVGAIDALTAENNDLKAKLAD